MCTNILSHIIPWYEYITQGFKYKIPCLFFEQVLGGCEYLLRCASLLDPGIYCHIPGRGYVGANPPLEFGHNEDFFLNVCGAGAEDDGGKGRGFSFYGVRGGGR